LVERGDHIRLQDIRLSYLLMNAPHRGLLPQSMEAYVYMGNVGLIWKRFKGNQDPDFMEVMPPARNIALGIRIIF
jgi:hypothetical protein